ncbi:hypothetical protein DPX16_19327 [Anabarilius grahami]|uniref:Uncharacterized protein n=1 Tax=Anabarilius grahami TaxID=495550 RepID=A0A3N0Z1L5_ANAGA|nr:hypothetical protein DPX16_19327 [Anabarilius grahami]
MEPDPATMNEPVKRKEPIITRKPKPNKSGNFHPSLERAQAWCCGSQEADREAHTPSHSPTHNTGLPTIVRTKTTSAAHYSGPIVDISGTNYKKQQQKSTRPAISSRAPLASRGTEGVTCWNVGMVLISNASARDLASLDIPGDPVMRVQGYEAVKFRFDYKRNIRHKKVPALKALSNYGNGAQHPSIAPIWNRRGGSGLTANR